MIKIDQIISWIPALLDGARVTILLTLVSVVTGIAMSIFLALGKMSKITVIKKLCEAYVFFFRGTPLLMQLYFIWFGLPMISPIFTIQSRFFAAWLAFSLNSAAYCTEIIRAALESIPKGQYEAAKALGMSYSQTMRLIIIPQSIRQLIPPIGNEFIMVLKDASIVSIIALSDLTKVTRSIQSSTSSSLVYIPAMIIYLIITAIFTYIFKRLEIKHSRY